MLVFVLDVDLSLHWTLLHFLIRHFYQVSCNILGLGLVKEETRDGLCIMEPVNNLCRETGLLIKANLRAD